jgi:hypothetical protein
MSEEVQAKASEMSDTSSSGTRPDHEPVRIIVSGSRYGVTAIIHALYQLGFAQISEWSKFQNEPHSGRLMRVLTKHVRGER